MRGRPKAGAKPLLLWLVMVAVLSLYPVPERAPQAPGVDKLAHVVMYGITSALMFVTFREAKKMSLTTLALASFAGAAGYGMLMEALQGMTTYRAFSMLDQLANTIGALAGTGAAFYKFKAGNQS